MKIFENTKKWLEKANPSHVDVSVIRKWINEELDEFEEALAKNNKEGMYDAVCDAAIFLANIPYFYDLDVERLSEYADAVNKSNWSKFCHSQQEAILTCKYYEIGLHPNKPGEKIQTYYTSSDNVYVVKKVSDEKILKSVYFKDTEEFLNKQ